MEWEVKKAKQPNLQFGPLWFELIGSRYNMIIRFKYHEIARENIVKICHYSSFIHLLPKKKSATFRRLIKLLKIIQFPLRLIQNIFLSFIKNPFMLTQQMRRWPKKKTEKWIKWNWRFNLGTIYFIWQELIVDIDTFVFCSSYSAVPTLPVA